MGRELISEYIIRINHDDVFILVLWLEDDERKRSVGYGKVDGATEQH
jgi:hypothetical protein